MRSVFNHIYLLGFCCLWPALGEAQETPGRRLANIVGVAVDEYAKAVDSGGRMVSEVEYQEAGEFLATAKDVAGRLVGDRAGTVRTALDSLIAIVERKGRPVVVTARYAALTESLGSEGALELPPAAPGIAAGRGLYDQYCASCHGALGLGDGPASRGMDPAPPALGDRVVAQTISPGLMYRVVSVGVPGTQMAAWAGILSPQQRWDVIAYVTTLRAPDTMIAHGARLYATRCPTCAPSPGGTSVGVPPGMSVDMATLAWQAEHSDSAMAETVGRALAEVVSAPPVSQDDVGAIVAYLRSTTWRSGSDAGAPGMLPTRTFDAIILARLDSAVTAARAGKSDEAADMAFDAYMAFEPLEVRARSVRPGLVSEMETYFAEFRAAIKASDFEGAERAREAVFLGLPEVMDLVEHPAEGVDAFWQSFLIIFREGLEAILVIGAVVTFLLKTGHRERLRSIWIGVGFGVLASAATAVLLRTLLGAMPASREILEGVTMLLAVLVLFSVSYWLISKVEAAKWQQFIRDQVTRALEHGGGTALAMVAFLAVYREGAETALFYQVLLTEGRNIMVPLLLGVVAGGAVLAVIFTVMYRFGVRIPLRPLFAVTSVLLYLMAFIFAGKGIRELQEGNAFSITGLPGAPTFNALGIYPTLETLVAQGILLALFVFALVQTFRPGRVETR